MRPLWAAPGDHTVEHDHERHGGADPLVLAALLDGASIADGWQAALALVTGLAANRSFETGLPVRSQGILEL